MTRARPAISVVVISYRDRATLPRAVRSLLAQEAGAPFEVLVVTSGDQGVGPWLGERFPSVRVIEVRERLLPGSARNRGVAASQADLIAFLAADCIAEPGWVEHRLRAHGDGHRLVASAVTPGAVRTPAALAAYYQHYHARLPSRPAGPVSHPDAGAHGLSFGRSVLERLGPFREELRTGEDTEFALRATEARIPIWFEPRIRTACPGIPGLTVMMKDQFHRGKLAGKAGGRDWPPLRLGPLRIPGAVAPRWMVATLRTTWRYSGRDRWRALALSPWILLGCLANRRGWRRGRRPAPGPGR